MADFPSLLTFPAGGVINCLTSGPSLVAESMILNKVSASTGGTWPAANTALYMPFVIDQVVTAYKMAYEVTVQSGNYDIGIYDYIGNRLVSKGSTAVPAAGLAVVDITDTELTPGVYYMALNIDNTTAAVVRSSGVAQLSLQVGGMQQQAVGAVTLPNPATFANPGQGYIPSLAVAFKSTI